MFDVIILKVLPSVTWDDRLFGLNRNGRFEGDGKLLNGLGCTVKVCWCVETSITSSSELLFEASCPRNELLAWLRLDEPTLARVGRAFFRMWECDRLLEDNLTEELLSKLFVDCLSEPVSSVNPRKTRDIWSSTTKMNAFWIICLNPKYF